MMSTTAAQAGEGYGYVVPPREWRFAAVREAQEVVLILGPIAQNTAASLILVTVLPGQWPDA